MIFRYFHNEFLDSSVVTFKKFILCTDPVDKGTIRRLNICRELQSFIGITLMTSNVEAQVPYF